MPWWFGIAYFWIAVTLGIVGWSITEFIVLRDEADGLEDVIMLSLGITLGAMLIAAVWPLAIVVGIMWLIVQRSKHDRTGTTWRP